MKTDRIAELYADPGPFASVYLDISRDMPDGNRVVELGARAAGESLAEQGAPDEIVEVVRSRLTESTHEPAPISRALVVTARGVILDELARSRPTQPTAVWDALPDVGAWIRDADYQVPFVLALVDHEGGDVSVHTSDAVAADAETSVGTPSPYEHKVASGGWSHLRYQRVAENVWIRNAEAVAAEVSKHVRAGVRLVIVAGDVHSRTEVAQSLDSVQAEVVQLETGGRAADGGEEALETAVRETLGRHAVAAKLADLHELRQHLGRNEAVATGVRDVVDALVRGQVERLLLDPDRAADFTVDPANHPGLALGAVSEPPPSRADQVLVAAAAMTGADVVITPASTLGGAPAMALLRWDEPAMSNG